MPSSEPFETTIATFSIVCGSVGVACRDASSSVIVFLLDAALGLRDAADLGGELRRALGEELVQLLHGNAGLLAERADRRCAPRREVALAHEADHEPMTVGQLRDAVLGGDCTS